MKRNKSIAIAASSALASATMATALAHERRILPADHGRIQLVVGFHVEPAFEDNFNAVDVILKTYDGACPVSGDPDTAPVLVQPIDVNGTASAADPDTVNLKVEALYLSKAAPPGGAPIGNVIPAGVQKKLLITAASPLKELFNSPGTYNSWFRPTHPGDGTSGAYGYHVFGKVHAGQNTVTCPGGTPQTLAARTATIDTYFVCGAGSLVPPDSFGCVTAVQPFPGQPEDEYKANRTSGVDR